MQSVIVTGGTGVTGSALIRYLLEREIEVTAIIRPNSIRKNYLPVHNLLKVIECELSEIRSLTDILNKNKYDVFFHLAWDGSRGEKKVDNRNNMYLQSQNILYLLDAVELCREIGCGVFLATGSQAEFGRSDIPITEEKPEKPENGYGMAKLCAGQMSRVICRKYGIRHIWARLFSIYGPWDGTYSLIDRSIRLLQEGKSPSYTAGDQIWDYLYSEDAAKALYLLAEYGLDGEVYCVANGEAHKLKEYIKKIHQIVNQQIEPEFGVIPYTPDQVMCLQADITKLKKQTGFYPEYTFEHGIQEIAEWIQQEKRR